MQVWCNKLTSMLSKLVPPCMGEKPMVLEPHVDSAIPRPACAGIIQKPEVTLIFQCPVLYTVFGLGLTSFTRP